MKIAARGPLTPQKRFNACAKRLPLCNFRSRNHFLSRLLTLSIASDHVRALLPCLPLARFLAPLVACSLAASIRVCVSLPAHCSRSRGSRRARNTVMRMRLKSARLLYWPTHRRLRSPLPRSAASLPSALPRLEGATPQEAERNDQILSGSMPIITLIVSPPLSSSFGLRSPISSAMSARVCRQARSFHSRPFLSAVKRIASSSSACSLSLAILSARKASPSLVACSILRLRTSRISSLYFSR